jgi:murein DD-endopeptidase MepM/ murein hydrolase activator NlpD
LIGRGHNMRNAKFRYNPETCQYEPVTLKVKNIIVYCLGLLVVSAVLLSGFILLYDRLTLSDAEAALRKENEILNKHQFILTAQLSEVEETLNGLKASDDTLNQKLFEETSLSIKTSSLNKQSILLADANDFTTILNNLREQSDKLNHQSAASNEQFSAIKITKNDVKILNALPTLQPITNTNLDLLVSGFGIRINPFHKGKYKHPGIDFAATRGTEVYATAPGKIIDINKSDLQAGYGNSIDVDHGHGFITRYAHLEEINVRPGQQVTKGTKIGTVGNSGGSIAPHLHYEVIFNNENVDPLNYMIEGLSSHEYNKMVTLSKKQNQSLD